MSLPLERSPSAALGAGAGAALGSAAAAAAAGGAEEPLPIDVIFDMKLEPSDCCGWPLAAGAALLKPRNPKADEATVDAVVAVAVAVVVVVVEMLVGAVCATGEQSLNASLNMSSSSFPLA